MKQELSDEQLRHLACMALANGFQTLTEEQYPQVLAYLMRKREERDKRR